MQLILLILGSLLTFSMALATAPSDDALKAKIAQYKQFRDKVLKECTNNPNSSKYSLSVEGTVYKCEHLLKIADRYKKQIDLQVESYKKNCELENNRSAHQTLAAQAAVIAKKSVACKPSPDRGSCESQFNCAMIGAASPSLMSILGTVGSLSMNKSAQQCGAQSSGCLNNVLRGIWDSLWTSLSLVWDVAKWATLKTGEMLGIVKKSEASTSERAMAAQKAGPGFIKKMLTHPIQTIQQFASDFYNSMKDAAVNHYGCEKWSGVPFISTCLKPMTTFECGTCQQKMQVWCGIAGYAAGEIVTAFITGGMISGGKLAFKGAMKLGSGPSKNVAGYMSRTFPKTSEVVGTAAAKVAALAAVGLTKAQKAIISSWEAMKSSNTTAILTRAAQTQVVIKAALLPVKALGAYLRAMDKAFVAGGSAVDDIAASVAARGSSTELTQAARAADQAMEAGSDAIPAVTVQDSVAGQVQEAQSFYASSADAVYTPGMQSAVTQMKSAADKLEKEIKLAEGRLGASPSKDQLSQIQEMKTSLKDLKDGITVKETAITVAVSAEKAQAGADKVALQDLRQKSTTTTPASAPQRDISATPPQGDLDVTVAMRTYRVDPEYASLFKTNKGVELYEEHHEELTMVISALEKSEPQLSKVQIRQKIEETLNSCQL